MCVCVLSTKSDLKYIWIWILFALKFGFFLLLLFTWSVLFSFSMFHFAIYVRQWQLRKKSFNRLLKHTWGIIIFFFASMAWHSYTQESTHFICHDIYLFDVRPKIFRNVEKKEHRIANEKKSTGLINKMRTFITCVKQIVPHILYIFILLFIEMLSHYHLIENRVGILMV